MANCGSLVIRRVPLYTEKNRLSLTANAVWLKSKKPWEPTKIVGFTSHVDRCDQARIQFTYTPKLNPTVASFSGATSNVCYHTLTSRPSQQESYGGCHCGWDGRINHLDKAELAITKATQPSGTVSAVRVPAWLSCGPPFFLCHSVTSSSRCCSESVRLALFIYINPCEFTRNLPKFVFESFLQLPSCL